MDIPLTMKKPKLTAVALPSLAPGEYTDHILPGLNLTIGARRKTWTLRHRIGGKQRRDTLGHFPSMGLAAAREAARQLSERVEAGAPIEPPPSHPRQGGKTVGEVIDLYEKARRKKGGRIKRLDAALRTVRSGLADYLKLPAKQFSKADLREARDRIGKRAPQQADRFRAYLAPIWKWASAEDHIDVNFVPDVLKIASITKRERTYHDEIQLIWEACGKLNKGDSARAFGRLVKFLLITGQRRDEGASLKYGHILHGTWRQADNKASRPHALKLPDLALDQIGSGASEELLLRRRVRQDLRFFENQARTRQGVGHLQLAPARSEANRR